MIIDTNIDLVILKNITDNSKRLSITEIYKLTGIKVEKDIYKIMYNNKKNIF